MWVVECGVQRDGCISMVKAADAQATVEALQKKYDDLLGKYRQLVDFYDKHNGTPCEQIRHQQQVEALQRERDRLRANLVNCVARLEAYYGEDYPAVRDAKAALTPAGGQDAK